MTLTIGPSARGSSGLTLLELVLVMVIICAALAMASPSLRGFFGSREALDTAARMAALTRYARAQAAAEGRVYRFHLDAADGRYWLTAQSCGAFEALPSEFGRVFRIPEGTAAAWEAPEAGVRDGFVSFYPDGRGQTADIRISGRQGRTVRLVCESPAEAFRVVDEGTGEAG